MKTLRILLALAFALVPLAAPAQDTALGDYVVLASNWNMNGEAADADQVVTVVAMTDALALTIAAQPDSCRLIDATTVDADASITAGTVTLIGTDCLGYPLTAVASVVSPAGVKTFSPPAYFSNVASGALSVLTGEGGADTITVGYTSNSEAGCRMYGRLKAPGPNGEHGVDPFGFWSPGLRVTTSGTSTTALTSVATNAAFTNVLAGDLLIFNVNGRPYYRRITIRTDANNVTLDRTITIPTAGTTFIYKRPYLSTNPWDEMWVSVTGYTSALFSYEVQANADTGGVVVLCECTARGIAWPTIEVQQIGTATVATGAAGKGTFAVDLRVGTYDACRLSMRFGTGDDADAAPEQLHASVLLSRILMH